MMLSGQTGRGIGVRVGFLAVMLSLVVFAGPAGASVVFQHNAEVWAMNDDGSNQHAIATAVQVPGTLNLYSPFANAAGVVTFSASWIDGEAERKHWNPDGPAGSCGAYCVGLYKLDGGVTTRLSPAPYSCPLNPCLISEDDGEFVGNGPVYYAYFFASATNPGCGSWCIDASQDKVVSRPLGGGGPTDFGGACDSATDPSPKPDGSDVVAYTGCGAGGNKELIVSGRNGASPATISYDDETQVDPSWSADGSTVLTAERGADPGVWRSPVPAVAANPPSQVVGVSAGDSVSSPRFIGSNTIGFVYNGDIWTVPANCNGCGPTSGARLTTNSACCFAWTPATSIRAVGDVPAGPAGGPGGGASTPGGTGGGAGTPGGTGGGGGGTSGGSTPPGITAAALEGKPKLGTALKKGFEASVTTTKGGAVTIDGTVAGKDARGLKVAATKVAARGRATAPGPGKHKVRLRFTKKAQKKFRRARSLKLTLQIAVVDAAGNRGTKTAKVTLKR